MPKKMISFGYSFIEKLREKRESKNKYGVEPPNLDKIVENSSEKKPQLLHGLSWHINLRPGHRIFYHRLESTVIDGRAENANHRPNCAVDWVLCNEVSNGSKPPQKNRQKWRFFCFRRDAKH